MVEFGSCRLDREARELWRDGGLVHLEPQAFDLLAFLLDQRARVVPKAEILDAVWGDQFVSESALTTRIKEIRRATGDDGTRQEVIANVRGRGYRFVATVVERAAAAAAGDEIVGRTRDLVEVAARLRPGVVVTVVGPGGVGKTTLARAVCRALDPPPADGVILVELAEIAEPSAVVPAVASAAEVVADATDVALLARTLAPLDAVLVLDNCEHVVGQAARLAKLLLEPAGRLRVLATSRERLGVVGEVVWPLLPLDRAAARELFLRRAHAAAPAFSLGSEEELDAILAALDDLPLAIEMAAARVASSSLAELRDEVRADPTGLRSPDRSSAPRHRTLTGVVAWSAERLPPDERGLFADLSAFAGPVGLEDVRAMLGDPPALRSRLGALVDHSLLVAHPGPGGTRFRMLETVRAVAAAGADPSLAARHAGWVASVAAECDAALRTPDEARAAARLGALSAELRAAHRWALHHDHALAAAMLASVHQHAYWRLWPEPAGWARDLLARRPGAGEAAAAAAVVSGDAANRARLAEARQFAELALGAGDPRTRAAALEVLADVELYEGRFDAVVPVVDELRRLGESAGEVHHVAISLVDGGLASLYGGRRAGAEQAVAGLDALGARLAPSDAAWVTYLRAELSPPAEAVDLLEEVVALASSVQNHLLVSIGQDSLGAALCRTGRVEESLAVLGDCLAGFLRHAHYTQTAPAVRNVVELLERLGDTVTAGALATDLRRLSGWDALGLGTEAGGRDPHRELLVAAHHAVRRHQRES